MTDNLHIREAKDSDETSIKDLFARVVGREFPDQRFRWLFIENVLGRGVCPVALVGEKLVGSTASVAIPFRDGTSRFDVFRLQDALVDADYRGQGIYTRLMLDSSRVFDERGVPFVFGYPNENSKRLFLGKGGYTLIDEIPTLGLDVALDGDDFPSDLEFRCSAPDSFSQDDTNLFNRHWDAVRFHTVRTPDYLRLRYSPEVGRNYVVVRGFDSAGLQALAIGKYYEPANSIDVVELVAHPSAGVLLETLRALRGAFRGEPATRFESWIWGANPLVAAAEELGFAPTGRTTNLIWRMNPALGLAPPARDELTITMGDSDVY